MNTPNTLQHTPNMNPPAFQRNMSNANNNGTSTRSPYNSNPNANLSSTGSEKRSRMETTTHHPAINNTTSNYKRQRVKQQLQHHHPGRENDPVQKNLMPRYEDSMMDHPQQQIHPRQRQKMQMKAKKSASTSPYEAKATSPYGGSRFLQHAGGGGGGGFGDFSDEHHLHPHLHHHSPAHRNEMLHHGGGLYPGAVSSQTEEEACGSQLESLSFVDKGDSLDYKVPITVTMQIDNGFLRQLTHQERLALTAAQLNEIIFPEVPRRLGRETYRKVLNSSSSASQLLLPFLSRQHCSIMVEQVALDPSQPFLDDPNHHHSALHYSPDYPNHHGHPHHHPHHHAEEENQKEEEEEEEGSGYGVVIDGHGRKCTYRASIIDTSTNGITVDGKRLVKGVKEFLRDKATISFAKKKDGEDVMAYTVHYHGITQPLNIANPYDPNNLPDPILTKSSRNIHHQQHPHHERLEVERQPLSLQPPASTVSSHAASSTAERLNAFGLNSRVSCSTSAEATTLASLAESQNEHDIKPIMFCFATPLVEKVHNHSSVKPIGTMKDVSREYNAIVEYLKKSTCDRPKEPLEMDVISASPGCEFQIRQSECRVLHYSGAFRDQSFILEDEVGQSRKVPAAVFTSQIMSSRRSSSNENDHNPEHSQEQQLSNHPPSSCPRLVFAMTDAPKEVAQAFEAAGVKHCVAVYSPQEQDDELALTFMKHFYQHLAEGRSVRQSFEHATVVTRNNECCVTSRRLPSDKFMLYPRDADHAQILFPVPSSSSRTSPRAGIPATPTTVPASVNQHHNTCTSSGSTSSGSTAPKVHAVDFFPDRIPNPDASSPLIIGRTMDLYKVYRTLLNQPMPSPSSSSASSHLHPHHAHHAHHPPHHEDTRETRLVAVTGSNGVGKSTIALAVARCISSRKIYVGGVHYFSVKTLMQNIFNTKLTHSGSPGRFHDVSPQKAVNELRRRLSTHLKKLSLRSFVFSRILVILDDCDHFQQSAALCREFQEMLVSLLHEHTGIHILLTITEWQTDYYENKQFLEKNITIPPLDENQALKLMHSLVTRTIVRSELRKGKSTGSRTMVIPD